MGTMMARFYARAPEGEPDESRWQLLDEHLYGAARRAEAFADAFASDAWGYLAGLWHDLGKYDPRFQARLRGDPVAVEHSGAGAALAQSKDAERGVPLAFAIAGHHAGLTNLVEVSPDGLTPLRERLTSNASRLEGVSSDIPADILAPVVPDLPPHLQPSRDVPLSLCRRRLEFWTRFLFSALVDADRLDAEAFFNPQRAAIRGGFASLDALQLRLNAHLEQLQERLAPGHRDSSINRLRGRVLQSCRAAAEAPSGHFSLTVPTGGGKTLSAMAFALAHGVRHGMRRVIAVIPYTSIIEQNAAVYRDALGTDAVLEHHSALDPQQRRLGTGEDATRRHQLATENWDVPVVVTTSVQFFESLFANHPSRCRKLHNVARSVIVLDEVQSLPPAFLRAILDGLQELVDHYGCSVVLSTATPPALSARNASAPYGLHRVRPILAADADLVAAHGRVRLMWPAPDDVPLQWPALADRLAEHDQVMTIVHRRSDARELAQELQRRTPADEPVHLSALMCPAHRFDVIRSVQAALRQGRVCRLVATQLVEAGVDLDFPLVYRALGGLDSMVQAAGRCNREGRLERGEVIIFRAPSAPPPGTPRRALEVTLSLLREWGQGPRLEDPAVFDIYFRHLYAAADLDARNIQSQREQFNFATVGQEFRLIEDGFTHPIIVPYGNAPRAIDAVRHEGPTREALRGLQRYVVSVYPKAFTELLEQGALEEISEGLHAIRPGYRHLYNDGFGLMVGDATPPDPADLIV